MGAFVIPPDMIVEQEFFTFLPPSSQQSPSDQIRIVRELHSNGFVEYSISFPSKSPPAKPLFYRIFSRKLRESPSIEVPCSFTMRLAPEQARDCFRKWPHESSMEVTLRYDRGLVMATKYGRLSTPHFSPATAPSGSTTCPMDTKPEAPNCAPSSPVPRGRTESSENLRRLAFLTKWF